MQTHQANDLFGETIFIYSRSQAKNDGTLVDISKIAKEAGFKIPVAVTAALWRDCIEWEIVKNTKAIQNTEGRLRDVISMLGFACKHLKNKSQINYRLYVVSPHRQVIKPTLVELKAVISGGDNGEPVITIMLAHED